MPDNYRFPPALLNSYHALAVLAGISFLMALLSPGKVGSLGGYAGFLGPPLFLSAMALLAGILGVHVGGMEQAWWATRPLPASRTLWRLAGLVALGLGLLFPFLAAFRALAGGGWVAMLGVAGLLFAVGLTWAGIGFITGSVIKSGGVRFIAVYGCLILVYFVPLIAALPVSPIIAVIALWKGDLEYELTGFLGWWGLAAVALGGVWLWKRRRY